MASSFKQKSSWPGLTWPSGFSRGAAEGAERLISHPRAPRLRVQFFRSLDGRLEGGHDEVFV